ncbi:uncharacterized protein LOC125500005 isoform X2 [Athalia rosae]|uniref:uncharacterized protein LOC125500005 isoform X2 n=1 Tax=Athalia rosae TaxID=37344 RepID=UPI0020340233|nr:uncharacterized protein LOC125500005 isoform X2 [Athalia rosae]
MILLVIPLPPYVQMHLGFPSWMVRQFGFSDSGGDIGSDISSTSPYSVSVAMQVPQSNDEERER